LAKASDFLVLVVDDEQDIRTYLSTLLEDAGFRVVTAPSGRDALEAVKRQRPDFISLDLVMPGGSGIGFLHELRRHREWINIPVMIVTGHAQDDLGRADLSRALEGKLLSGPQTYLEKPVAPASYVEVVCNALGVDVPGAVALGDPEALRSQAAQLLRDVPSDRLAEVLALLKDKGGTPGRG
jgi:CheY-like chemotaxis protein